MQILRCVAETARVLRAQERSNPGETGWLRRWEEGGTLVGSSRMGALGLGRGTGASGEQHEIRLSIDQHASWWGAS